MEDKSRRITGGNWQRTGLKTHICILFEEKYGRGGDSFSIMILLIRWASAFEPTVLVAYKLRGESLRSYGKI